MLFNDSLLFHYFYVWHLFYLLSETDFQIENWKMLFF